MNGQAEDHSPLAKAVDELEHIKGRRYPLAWAQLKRLNAMNAVAADMAEALKTAVNGTVDRGWILVAPDFIRAALEAYEKALQA